MTGHGPVLDLGWPIRDHHHPGQPPSSFRRSAGASCCPTRAQTAGQFTSELATTLNKQGLVDGLVAHSHLQIIGEVEEQALRNLFWRPQLLKPPSDFVAESPRP